MAKKQTFESKIKKVVKGPNVKVVKLVYSYQAPGSGSWRFAEKLVKMPVDANEQEVLDAELKAGLAYLESQK